MLDIILLIALLLNYYISDEEHYINFIGFLRVKKIIRNTKMIEEKFHLMEKFPAVTTLTKLLFLIFTLAHYCCCGFYYMANSQPQGVRTWLDLHQ